MAGLRALYTEVPHHAAVAPDPVAAELVHPVVGGLARRLGTAPLLARAAHRALGVASLGLTYTVPLRTAAIDDVLRGAVRASIRQVVLLGAGLDARAWRLPELDALTVYEVDHPATQAHKRARVAAFASAGRLGTPPGLRYCALDFETERLVDVLPEAGFDATAPSVWVWEGVTMYLRPAGFRASLDAIGELTAPGSRLALTYIPRRYAALPLRALASLAGRIIGEPLHGPLASPELHAALDSGGFVLVSDESARDWVGRYWPSERLPELRAYERLAVAVRR